MGCTSFLYSGLLILSELVIFRNFPGQLTTSRIGNLTRLIYTLLYVMTIPGTTYGSFVFYFCALFWISI